MLINMDMASSLGDIQTLKNWLNLSNSTGFECNYTTNAIYLASKFNHVNVLNWWIASGLPLKISQDSYEDATGDAIKFWETHLNLQGEHN